MASMKTARATSASKLPVVPHTRIEDDKKFEEYYEKISILGRGSFGTVHKVKHRESKEHWAAKEVHKEKAGHSGVLLLEREVANLKKVRHEHIIKLKEVLETPNNMYMIMEYCDRGELADMLKPTVTLNEQDTKKLMKRLASAVAYLHKNDLVHRDIKLENILLSTNTEDATDNTFLKLTDFGLSVESRGKSHDDMMNDFCGTPMYMAPEITESKSYSAKCDVWAMGVIMFRLLSGRPPFQSKDEEVLYDLIKNVNVQKLFDGSDLWKAISEEAKDCIKGMLTVDPAHRLTASEVLDHPWITGKSLDQGATGPRNVLDMMKAWKDELTIDTDNCKKDDSNNNSTACSDTKTEPKVSSAPSPTSKGRKYTRGRSTHKEVNKK